MKSNTEMHLQLKSFTDGTSAGSPLMLYLGEKHVKMKNKKEIRIKLTPNNEGINQIK